MNANPSLPQVVINHTQLLTHLGSGQLLQLDSKRRGALIICKRHHAELAGPGSAIGGFFDLDCVRLIPIGDVALIYPQSYPERQKAFLIRLRWMTRVQQVTAELTALKRAKLILDLLKKYFTSETVAKLPDEILAQLVGVLPRTVRMVRYPAPPPPRPSFPLTSETAQLRVH